MDLAAEGLMDLEDVYPTQDNRNFDSYSVYANDLSPGYHRILITLNEQTTPIKDLPFVVEN